MIWGSTRLSSSHSTAASASASTYSPANFTRPLPKPQASPAASSSSSSSSSSTSSSSSLRREPHALPAGRPHYAYPQARRPPVTEIPGVRLTPWTWVKWMFGWRPTPTYKPAPIQANNNPYRARKQWPPDFRNLDPKYQFHLEKTYRRRAALKWARPTWNKSIKILQQTLITFTLIYFVFICEPTDGQGTPFDGFRAWFFEKLGSLGQLPDATRHEADKLSEDAKKRLVRANDISNSPTAS
ncbi:hypothetical protein A1O3_10096 [Capronia epimyces CBS 606.96]|uniref:Uncharacterized protein n=1 Tax=Capronia epimyces CBS 606.96 TaxID=1182542 RepID=W9Y3B6_9EURO|nr:uncharacterized protein A1O3_10096 [Capronia epimyces CBS 606.96]EXJ76939.1 hypothetical protein A1O3_10096 [Capronia epimyces CBS 606.96]